MANCNDSILIFATKKRNPDPKKTSYTDTDRPLSTNKLAQYQVDRWFRSFSAPNTKPKLRSQVRSALIPNLSSHKAAEEMPDCKPQ